MPANKNHSTHKPFSRAYVLHVTPPPEENVPEVPTRDADAMLAEAVNLTAALSGLKVVGQGAASLSRINPKLFIGGGRAEELAAIVAEQQVDVVVVNTQLSPSQQRNLELALATKVIDRTGLILEIFAERARTKAGRLQVELAQLNYQASRLVRSWTHLERQRGGLGKAGGPGERQIELDRRLLKDRMTLIKNELKTVEKERALHRRARNRAGTPVVALVGYTNAGKSTLFNALVGEQALAKDMLFATLDPLMRQLKLPSGRQVVLSDTVGFISDLPHELVAAFKATLEEVASADILLQVHDASSANFDAQNQDVRTVLASIGASDIPTIHVLNKADLLADSTALQQRALRLVAPVADIFAEPESAHEVRHKPAEDNRPQPLDVVPDALRVSALTGQGVDAVAKAIDKLLAADMQELTLSVDIADGRRLAWLHAHGEVLAQKLDEKKGVYRLRVLLSPANAGAFKFL